MSYNLLMPALGLANYSLNTGKRRILAACLIAATALSHVVFGYAAIVSVAIMALAGPRGDRSRRVVRAASILVPTFILLAWFVVPMLLASGEANRCRWDDVWKFDSWGAKNILSTLLSGRFFDEGRWPVMTVALAVSSMLALYRWKRPMPRRLLVLTRGVAGDFLRPHDLGIFHARAGIAPNLSREPFRVGLRVVCGSADGLGTCQNNFGRVADRIRGQACERDRLSVRWPSSCLLSA